MATILGFALLITALFARLYSVTQSGIEGTSFPYLFLVTPFVFFGIGGIVIGIVAFSVPSLDKGRKKEQQEIIVRKEERELIRQENETVYEPLEIKTSYEPPKQQTIEQPQQQTIPNIEKKTVNNTFSYMLFILGVVLIIVGIYLGTYTTTIMVDKPMTIYGYTINVPTAEQIQPYLPIGIIAMILSVFLIVVSLYTIKRAIQQ